MLGTLAILWLLGAVVVLVLLFNWVRFIPEHTRGHRRKAL